MIALKLLTILLSILGLMALTTYLYRCWHAAFEAYSMLCNEMDRLDDQ